MNKIHCLLDEISLEAMKYGIDLATNMYPGATRDQVVTAFEGLPFKVPDDILLLYQWRNGVRLEGQTCEIRMFPRFYFRTIDDAVDSTRTFISLANDPEMQWQQSWFCLCTDLAGDCLAIDAMPGDSDFGRIFYVGELVEPFPAFWSMETMLCSVLECYKAGAFFIDDNGVLAQDVDTSDPIYRRLNNGLSPCYWKSK